MAFGKVIKSYRMKNKGWSKVNDWRDARWLIEMTYFVGGYVKVKMNNVFILTCVPEITVSDFE